jgi:hypothetical protein
MAWIQVNISHGKIERDGMMKGSQIVVGQDFSKAKTIKVNGKPFEVESCEMDAREENWVIELSNESVQEQSDDEPVEGGDAS